MEQCPSWVANPFSASQEIPRTIWNPKVHCRIHKFSSPLPIQSQINTVHSTSWRSVLILYAHLSLDLPSGLFLLRFPRQNLACTSPLPIHATCPAHFILLDLVTRIIFSEDYWSLCSSICSFLHPPVISSLLGPSSLLSTPIFNTHSLHSHCS